MEARVPAALPTDRRRERARSAQNNGATNVRAEEYWWFNLLTQADNNGLLRLGDYNHVYYRRSHGRRHLADRRLNPYCSCEG